MRLTRYFNPRAPCGARQALDFFFYRFYHISIHAPLAGRDSAFALCAALRRSFQSTRPLRGATNASGLSLISSPFQSTRPLRGATYAVFALSMSSAIFQSTRPLRGATCQLRLFRQRQAFQSTRPLRGATIQPKTNCRAPKRFQSTRPLRGATQYRRGGFVPVARFQSTRPLRGATTSAAPSPGRTAYFNPRAPCGARHPLCATKKGRFQAFQSTRPLRGATAGRVRGEGMTMAFQSTRPLRGATACPWGLPSSTSYFNPRAPCGARRHV